MKRKIYFIVKFFDAEPQFSIEDGPFTDPDEAFDREKEIIVQEMCDVNGWIYEDAKAAIENALSDEFLAGDIRFGHSDPTLASVTIFDGGQVFYQVVEA